MKNSPSRSPVAAIATSLAILSSGCSGTQLFGEEKTCEQQADEYADTLYDLDVMLSAANIYNDMIKNGSPTAVANSEELRTKILAKFKQANAQQKDLKRNCGNQLELKPNRDDLAGVPRFAMLIASIRLRIQKLGNYLESTADTK